MTPTEPDEVEATNMNKGGMTTLTGSTGTGTFGTLKAKPIKSASFGRGLTRRKAMPKRSFSSSYKK